MPIYEYECDNCHKIIEVTQRISEPPLTKCPECQGHLQKLISRTSFQLKGTGWYSSDYKTNPSAAPDPIKREKELDGEKTKSYLEQTPDERKSTIKEITNKVANRM